MRLKICKDMSFSIRMECHLWAVLEKSVQKRILEEGLEMEPYLWFLLKEILEKIQMLDGGGTLKIRRSEFFALFDEGTIQWVDEPTQILLNNLIESLRRKIFVNQNF